MKRARSTPRPVAPGPAQDGTPRAPKESRRESAPLPELPRFSRAELYCAAALALCLWLTAASNTHLLNTDAVAYLRLAGYWVDGPRNLAVSGYWGPLLSWLIAPALALGAQPLVAARVAMAVSAAVFWWGCVALLRRFDISSAARVAGLWICALAAVCWSVQFISPDLLVAGLLCLAVDQLLSPAWTTTRRAPALAGLLWGLAFHAKAVALPLAVVITATVAILKARADAARRPPAARSLALTLGVCALAALPWVSTLSLHYGRLTVSTSARIAHAIVGPADVDRSHPFGRTFHQPEPGRLTSWEDPSRMAYADWSPFANAIYARHQLDLMGRNVVTIARLLGGLDALWIGLVCALAGLAWQGRSRDAWRATGGGWAALCVGWLGAVYVPVYVKEVDQRYFYAALPLLFIAAVDLIEAILRAVASGEKIRRWLAPGLVGVCFLVPLVEQLPGALQGVPDPASLAAQDLATRLRKAGARGPVAGSAIMLGGRAGLYTAFLLGERWLGDAPDATPAAFWQSGAQLIILRRDQPAAWALLTDGAFRNLDDQLFGSALDAANYPLQVFTPAAAATNTPGIPLLLR